MLDWIWDGKMDCGWEDLSKLLKDSSVKFVNIMSKTTAISFNAESKNLINNECMERFKQLTELVANLIEDAPYYAYEDLKNTSQNASKLNCWILLGSLTETALQMFLAFYIDDYKNTKWQLWENFKTEQVKEPIMNCISDLAGNKVIDNNQAKSLKEAIKETIKEHTKEHSVQKIMLDELIQFYSKLDLMDEDDINYLKIIQSNRNGIHSFQSRSIGTWSDLQFSIRFFCYLLDWIENHLPDITDYE